MSSLLSEDHPSLYDKWLEFVSPHTALLFLSIDIFIHLMQ